MFHASFVARMVGCGTLLLVMSAPPIVASELATVEGRVTAVTVYQGQALVTRELELPNAKGLVEVVVTNLPASVVPGSLFAEPASDLQVRSVRYRDRPIEEDVRKEVRALDEQIQNVQDQLAAIAAERGVLGQRMAYLMQLGQFSAVTAQQELKSGVLQAETLKDLTQFLFSERDTISKRGLELSIDERAQTRQRDLLTRKREAIAAGSSRTVREAVIFVNVASAEPLKLRLSYLVGNASWSPSYNARATAARDEITLEYNASIQQLSGEDWNDIEMTLSTASPSLLSSAPVLEPLTIKLGQIAPLEPATQSASANSYVQIRQKLKEIDKLRRSNVASEEKHVGLALQGQEDSAVAASSPRAASGGIGSPFGAGEGFSDGADRVLNRAARELQLLDFSSSLRDIREQKAMVDSATEGVSVSYRLANRTSLPSRADRQLIQIASVPLKGDFYRIATPVLTEFVYEEVRLTNTSGLVLLAGPLAAFSSGQFVGRGALATITAGESFTIGLGIDASLRAERVLANRVERTQGGNRVVEFTYELVLENFSDKPAKLRLLDRLPTTSEDDIKITLIRSDVPVSDDATYQLANRKDGILRWDVEVPAHAIGPNRKVIRYIMQIEYDKQLAIVGMTND